jgi:Cys-tRNA(Pro)/Cys-tRNA(Cys) deacylase
MTINNVTRLLEQRRIPYQSFVTPTEKLGAIQTANFLGVEPGLVFKTIVVVRATKGKAILALVPGDCELDLKLLAKGVNEKKLLLPTEREAETLTGLQAGGISPLALINKGFQVILDATSQEYPEIYISGGQRGLSIRLPVSELVKLTNAQIVEIRQPLAK